MLTMITSHTKKLISEYKNKIDILEIYDCDIPISFLNAEFKNKMLYATIKKKEELDECIIFGYSIIHKFFETKGYLNIDKLPSDQIDPSINC
jgi:hypothetical protein